MSLTAQLAVEVSKSAKSIESSEFYKRYRELFLQNQDLIEKGILQPRGYRLRSISDPPIDPLSLPGLIRSQGFCDCNRIKQ